MHSHVEVIQPTSNLRCVHLNHIEKLKQIKKKKEGGYAPLLVCVFFFVFLQTPQGGLKKRKPDM